MFFRFNIFFLAVLFAVNLWASASLENYSTWIGLVFSLILIVATKLAVHRWRYLIIPTLLVPGSVFLLSLIDAPFQMRLFAISYSLIFYLAVLAGWRLFHYEKDQTAKAMHNFAAIAGLFSWYAAAYGWYLNVALPIWGLMVLFSVATYFAAFSSFAVNQIERKKNFIHSIFLAFLAAQIIWVQNFWPFGYLTTAVIALIIYSVGWEIILNYFLEKITVRTIVFELLFLFGSALLILLSTRWYPVT